MTSFRKRRANQATAMHSTGPKTAAGMAVAARNARRHGLAIPVLSDPVWGPEVEVLVHRIAPEGSPTILVDLAGRIAEAQIDVMRVRRARADLVDTASDNWPFDQ